MWGIELFGWILGLAIVGLAVWLVLVTLWWLLRGLEAAKDAALDAADRWLRAHTP